MDDPTILQLGFVYLEATGHFYIASGLTKATCILSKEVGPCRLVLYSHSFTNPGPIDVEMVGLTEIVNSVK